MSKEINIKDPTQLKEIEKFMKEEIQIFENLFEELQGNIFLLKCVT